MITAMMLALAYWLLGLLIALSGFCALGCVIGLFLSVLYAFKSPIRLVAAPLWALFAFALLGICWMVQWIYVTLGDNTNHEMQFWYIVGAIIPGILGVTLVPKFIALAHGGSKPVGPPAPGVPAKV